MRSPRPDLPLTTPARGDNGSAGNFEKPGTKVANVAQQDYFAKVATEVVLPMFKARNKPFVLVFWSRDPDGTQHNQGDSLNELTPGINGPTSLAAIKNADDNLKRAATGARSSSALRRRTDIVVAADHGFSTISKQSATSPAAKAEYKDVPKGFLPPGFVAIDLAKALGLPLFDPGCQERAGRRQCPSGARQRPDRRRPGQAGRRGRGQWRLRSRLSAERRSRARRAR